MAGYYQTLTEEELHAELARLLAIKDKQKCERRVISGSGFSNYNKACQHNFYRLESELRCVEGAIKQLQDCRDKVPFQTKQQAAHAAAQMRRKKKNPAITYYKCPHCKLHHVTKYRLQGPVRRCQDTDEVYPQA